MNWKSFKQYPFPNKSLLFILLFLFVTQINAVMIEALPNESNVFLGNSFQIDLVISGLEQQNPNEVVRGFHIDIGYDAAIVNATSVIFGEFLSLNHPLGTLFQKSDISTAGYVTAEEVSLWSESFLDIQQPDSFILASIGFDAIGIGDSLFEFLPYLNFGIDIKGLDALVLPITVQSGLVNVHPVSVTEPATLLILGIGLLLISLFKKGD